jgi:glycine betaine/proline transport system substrate-binding protein
MNPAGFLSTGAFLWALAGPAMATETVVIGILAWPSAQVTTHIIAETLEEKLGADVELRERGTMTILADINLGSKDGEPGLRCENHCQDRRMLAGS